VPGCLPPGQATARPAAGAGARRTGLSAQAPRQAGRWPRRGSRRHSRWRHSCRAPRPAACLRLARRCVPPAQQQEQQQAKQGVRQGRPTHAATRQPRRQQQRNNPSPPVASAPPTCQLLVAAAAAAAALFACLWRPGGLGQHALQLQLLKDMLVGAVELAVLVRQLDALLEGGGAGQRGQPLQGGLLRAGKAGALAMRCRGGVGCAGALYCCWW
jgi:hypothetical protein